MKYLLYFFLISFLLFTYPLNATYILRYTTTDNGGILFTGNTLGLSKAAGQNQPGPFDSIGTFITTDLTQQVGNYLPGTTLAWQSNSSTAFLDLPANSTVLYAELIWSGSFGFNNQITGNVINTPINFITPQNQTFTIVPDPTTSQFALTPGFTNAGDYTRSANVTAIVQVGGAGVYTAGGVPATVSALDDTHNAAGWTLAVVFQNGAMVTSNLSLFVGAEQASTVGASPAAVSGFCVPNMGPLQGSLFISAIEGDANKGGDHMLFGNSLPLTISANSLSGSNNPIDNFFASQINTFLPFNSTQFVGSGQLDTRGSFGSYNANPFTGQIFPGSRQGYDITSVDISNKLVYGETTAYAQGTTTGDDYMINALGLQIQVGAPTIVITKQVNGGDVSSNLIGDTVTFSFTVTNVGTENAESAVFVDALENNLNYVPSSLLINGVPVAGNPTMGISLGNINVGATLTVQFQVLISGLPENGNIFFNNASTDYQFQPCGRSVQSFTSISNDVSIELPDVNKPTIVANKSANSLTNVEASVGNTIFFSTAITNNGQADAINAVFSDSLPPGLTVVPGTVTIDGVSVIPDPDLSTGFPIGPVPLGETVTVSFIANVEAFPPNGIFFNTATVNFAYLNLNNPDPLDPLPLPPVNSNPVVVNLAVPPRGFEGTFKKCEYLNYDRYCVHALWVPTFSSDVIAYEIYLGKQLVGTTSSKEANIKICKLEKKQQVYDLTLRALYAHHVRSTPLPIKINP